MKQLTASPLLACFIAGDFLYNFAGDKGDHSVSRLLAIKGTEGEREVDYSPPLAKGNLEEDHRVTRRDIAASPGFLGAMIMGTVHRRVI